MHSGTNRSIRIAIARQRGNNQVVGGTGRRIETASHIEILEKRSWPTMKKDNRFLSFVSRRFTRQSNEMNIQTLRQRKCSDENPSTTTRKSSYSDSGLVMIEFIQFLHGLFPVELLDEILSNTFCCLSIESVARPVDLLIIDEYLRFVESCFTQSIDDIIDLRTIKGDLKRSDGEIFRRLWRSSEVFHIDGVTRRTTGVK